MPNDAKTMDLIEDALSKLQRAQTQAQQRQIQSTASSLAEGLSTPIDRVADILRPISEKMAATTNLDVHDTKKDGSPEGGDKGKGPEPVWPAPKSVPVITRMIQTAIQGAQAKLDKQGKSQPYELAGPKKHQMVMPGDVKAMGLSPFEPPPEAPKYTPYPVQVHAQALTKAERKMSRQADIKKKMAALPMEAEMPYESEDAKLEVQRARAAHAKSPIVLAKAQERMKKAEKKMQRAQVKVTTEEDYAGIEAEHKGAQSGLALAQEAMKRSEKGLEEAHEKARQGETVQELTVREKAAQKPFAKASKTLGDASAKAKAMGADETGDKIGEMADIAQLGGRAAAGDPTAIAQLAKKAIEKVKEKIAQAKQVGVEMFDAAQSEKAGDVGAHGGRAVKSLGKFAGSKTLEIMGDFTEQIFKGVETLRDWNQSLHNANMQFAEFSASMAAVQAQQEVRDIELSRERGDRRAAGATTLAESKHELETAFAPMEDLWADIKSWFLTWFNSKLARTVEDFNKYLDLFSFGGGPSDDSGNLGALKDIEKGWADKYARPPRHGP